MTRTMLSDILTAELARLRFVMGRGALDILETGCIRNTHPSHQRGDGWSTLTFAEHVRDHGGSSTSIDLDTSNAAKILADRGLSEGPRLLTGDSVLTLGNLAEQERTFDVILLDSGDDPGLIFREYEEALPMARSGGLILVDDVAYYPDSCGSKGDVLVPFLHENSLPFRIERRWGGGGWIDVVAIDVS